MGLFTLIGLLVIIIIGVPALFIILDCACAWIARQLWRGVSSKDFRP